MWAEKKASYLCKLSLVPRTDLRKVVIIIKDKQWKSEAEKTQECK